MDPVEPDAVAELAQPGERLDAGARIEVVELAAGHQEVRGGHAPPGFELGHSQRGVERHVDVVPEQQVARLRRPVEEREAVAALARRVEQLEVVGDVERAACYGSTSTSTSAAADSERASASGPVAPSAIT